MDLVPASALNLPTAEMQALFAHAVPLEGLRNLLQPSPEHQLLILARRVDARGRVLAERHLGRLEQILIQDPRAWHNAYRRSATWGVRDALVLLQPRGLDGAGPDPPSAARIGEFSHTVKWSVRRVLSHAKSGYRIRGHVISFSGLDGAGKSSQAEALRETLEQLGFDPVVRWTKLASNPALRTLFEPIKRSIGWAVLVINPGSTGRRNTGLLT